jgi:outer membrane protein assembly factor BamB
MFEQSVASRFALAVVAAGVSILPATVASAALTAGMGLYGVQPGTGRIVNINPVTGAVNSFYNAPGTIAANNTLIGLSGAESSAVLLYRNDNSATPNTLYRLNALTGAILSTHTTAGFSTDGLSWESNGSDRIYSSHTNTDVHVQVGYGGTESFGFSTGAPRGGLAGDGFGREFGFFSDGLIHEYDPFVDNNTYISNLPSPAADIQGLAYDGTNLYASTASGSLYTLNASTGAILNTTTVPGGALFGLGVAAGVPEPTSAGIFALAGLSLFRRVRRSR